MFCVFATLDIDWKTDVQDNKKNKTSNHKKRSKQQITRRSLKIKDER